MKKAKSTIKRGRISQEEKTYIEQNFSIKTDEMIAHYLKRPIERVREYRLAFLTHNPHLAIQKLDHDEIVEGLRKSPEWEFVKQQYTKDELTLFEHSYANLIRQFNKDILETERKQINNSINLEIFIHRHNIERMQSQTDIDRLQTLIKREMNKPVAQQDEDKLKGFEECLQAARAANTSKTRELKDLMTEHANIIKHLKGTREQRIAKIENSKQTFVGLLKELENEETRKSIGIEMNLMEAAVNVKKEELSNFHNYQNGEVDRPLLNSKTVKKED